MINTHQCYNVDLKIVISNSIRARDTHIKEIMKALIVEIEIATGMNISVSLTK